MIEIEPTCDCCGETEESLVVRESGEFVFYILCEDCLPVVAPEDSWFLDWENYEEEE